MSVFMCGRCGEMKDGDYDIPQDTMEYDDCVCESCVTDMIECEKCEAIFDEPTSILFSPNPWCACPKCGAKVKI